MPDSEHTPVHAAVHLPGVTGHPFITPRVLRFAVGDMVVSMLVTRVEILTDPTVARVDQRIILEGEFWAGGMLEAHDVLSPQEVNEEMRHKALALREKLA